MEEKVFEKYDSKGADYHWRQINKWSPLAFNAFVCARYDFFAREIKKLSKDKNVKIIDFGCGDGVQLYLIKKTLEKYGGKIDISGIDLSEKALSVAQNHLDGSFRRESVYRTSFNDESFDISISSDVIEHVNDPISMVEEMRRVTKPGGIMIIGTPVRFTEKPLDSMHVKEFFPEEFRSLFASDKFELLSHIETHPLLLYLMYQKNISIMEKKIPLLKYLINIFAVLLNKNFFLNSKKNKQDTMAYQFAVLRKT